MAGFRTIQIDGNGRIITTDALARLTEQFGSGGGSGGGPIDVETNGDGTYTITQNGNPVIVTTNGDGTYQIGA